MVLGVVRMQESYHISHRDHSLSWEQTPSPAVAHSSDLCLPHSHPPVLLPSLPHSGLLRVPPAPRQAPTSGPLHMLCPLLTALHALCGSPLGLA